MATDLHYAADAGDIDIVTNIITANGNIDINARDYDYETPISWAATRGHNDIVQYLFNCGADPNTQDVDGNTPLHWAAIRGHFSTVRLLIGIGAVVVQNNADEFYDELFPAGEEEMRVDSDNE